MSKEFYRVIKVLKFCKRCRTEYRPQTGSFSEMTGYCHACRKYYYAEWYKKYRKPYLKGLSPERLKEHRRKEYEIWKEWVKKNIIKRRKIALESYHRTKHKHKKRRHRATKKN